MSRERQEGPDERLVALLQALPVAFVRREEFDAAYKNLLFPKEPAGYQVVTGENEEPERETDFVDRTEERPSLNDSPCILPELSTVVFQGFVQETDGNHATVTEQGKSAGGKAKYFTVEQAARLAKIPPDELFAVMYDNPVKPAGTKWIFPGVEITQPLAVNRLRTTGKSVAESKFPGGGMAYESFEEEITGFFELYDLPTLNSMGYTEPVNRLHTPDMQGAYRIPGGCSFHKDQLRISAEALAYFLEESSIQVPQFLVDLCNGEGFEPFEDEGTGGKYLCQSLRSIRNPLAVQTSPALSLLHPLHPMKAPLLVFPQIASLSRLKIQQRGRGEVPPRDFFVKRSSMSIWIAAVTTR
jgi:hypothetical protein